MHYTRALGATLVCILSLPLVSAADASAPVSRSTLGLERTRPADVTQRTVVFDRRGLVECGAISLADWRPNARAVQRLSGRKNRDARPRMRRAIDVCALPRRGD